MASVETDGEVSGEVDPGNMQTIDNGDISETATSVDPDNDDASELATSVNQEEEEWDFSQKSWREDLELVVEGKTLHVASNILSLLSPVFTSMFEERFQGDGPKRIELTDKKHDDFVQFLRCLYPNFYQQITEDNVFAVLPLADEYRVKQLKTACEDFLVDVVSAPVQPEVVCKYLQLAVRHDMTIFKAKCLKIAARLDSKSLSDAEKVQPLSPEIKVEVQSKQVEYYRKSVSKLRMEKQKQEENCNLLEEYMLHDWMGTKGKEKFSKARPGMIKLKVSDLSTFQEHESTETTVHGINWYINAKSTGFQKKQLSLYLNCIVPEDWYKWECEVDMKFWLLNKELGRHLMYGSSGVFSPPCTALGHPFFISFQDLTSGTTYVVDDTFEINVYFLVNEPTCRPNPEHLHETTESEDDTTEDESAEEDEADSD